MTNRPRYSLKAMLVFIAVLSVPLTLIGMPSESTRWPGVLLLFPVLGAGIGHLVDPRTGAEKGMLFGALLSVAVFLFLATLYYALMLR